MRSPADVTCLCPHTQDDRLAAASYPARPRHRSPPWSALTIDDLFVTFVWGTCVSRERTRWWNGWQRFWLKSRWVATRLG